MFRCQPRKSCVVATTFPASSTTTPPLTFLRLRAATNSRMNRSSRIGEFEHLQAGACFPNSSKCLLSSAFLYRECRCAERLLDIRSDEEDHEEDAVAEVVGAGGTELSKGCIFCTCGKTYCIVLFAHQSRAICFSEFAFGRSSSGQR